MSPLISQDAQAMDILVPSIKSLGYECDTFILKYLSKRKLRNYTF